MAVQSREAFAKIDECTGAYDPAAKSFNPDLVDGSYLVYALRIVWNTLKDEQQANWELEKKTRASGPMSDQKATNKALLRMDTCFEHFNRVTGTFTKPVTDAFVEQTFEQAAAALKAEKAKHQALEQKVPGL